MNIDLAKRILQGLYSQGVCDFCLCPGSRNAPLIAVLEHARNIRLHFFFDERSAAFFALGRIARDSAPVAVVTTSGTAVAELLPAAVEAHYRALPLVLLTADRPARFRNSGAPQSIEQVGIFSHYVAQSLDLTSESPDLNFALPRGPVHINVRFDEPLLDHHINLFNFDEVRPFTLPEAEAPDEDKVRLSITQFCQRVRSPVILLCDMKQALREATTVALKNSRVPIYAESLSGLRESGWPTHLLGGERIFKFANFDGVIRIGGVPTARFWRDLEKSQTPVLHIADESWPGLTRGQVFSGMTAHLALRFLREELTDPPPNENLYLTDEKMKRRLEDLLLQESASEPGLLGALSHRIAIGSRVYLGNSLPIREWDLAATRESRAFSFSANRGANGIDGQLSTFFGWCHPHQENWAIIGDLTALYDLNSPWILSRELHDTPLRIVIINNSGGQIFSRLYTSPSFVNAHNLDFSAWAKMWDLSYLRWERIPQKWDLAPRQVIELRPDPASTERFWRCYEDLTT